MLENHEQDEEYTSFWHKLSNYTDSSEKKPFETISKFALRVGLLPVSNASSERKWSLYNRIKRKDRCCLQFENVKALSLIYQYINDVGGIESFDITPEMLTRIQESINIKINEKRDIGDPKLYGDFEIHEKSIMDCLEEDQFCKGISKIIKTYYKNMKEVDPCTVNLSENCIENSENFSMSAEDVHKNCFTSTYKVEKEIMAYDDSLKEKIDDLFVHESNHNNEVGDFLGNGLIYDCNYYFTKLCQISILGTVETVQYTVGKYYNNLFRHELKMFSGDYQTLQNCSWLSNEGIDACSLVSENYWNNTIFVPSSQTYFIFNRNLTSDRVGRDWFMLTVQFPDTGNILMPILRENYWILLVINVNERTFKILDPIKRLTNDLIMITKELFLKFVNYINICKNFNVQNIFTNNTWTTDWCTSARPYQKDSYNCGVYIM